MPEGEKGAAYADGTSLFTGAPSNHVTQMLNMRNTGNMGIYSIVPLLYHCSRRIIHFNMVRY